MEGVVSGSVAQARLSPACGESHRLGERSVEERTPEQPRRPRTPKGVVGDLEPRGALS